MNADGKINSLREMQESFEILLQTIFGPKFYSDAKQFAVKHPFLSAAVLFIGLFSLLPMLVFLVFTAITIFIAIICFVCIEGSIIAIGGIIFLGIVCFISVIVVSILSSLAVAYFILQRIRSFFRFSSLPCFNPHITTNDEHKTE